MRLRLWALLLLGTAAPAIYANPAQQPDAPIYSVEGQLMAPPPPPAPTGYPVTGRAVCADTQRAARFAQVTLIAAVQSDNGFRGGQRLSARTDLDGNFTVQNVPPGDYYVTGSMTGYINTATLVQSTLNTGADPGSTLAGVPLIHVSAGGASTALSLQRGGVIAGSVQWDDGTPAAGVSVSVQPVPPTPSTGTAGTTANTATTVSQLPTFGRPRGFGGGYAGTQTDDRGRFRLSGLAPGSYYLRASVQAPAPQKPEDRGFARPLNISVYAPDKVRRTEATPVTLGAGEERDDLNVVLGLAALHNVSGTVSASGGTVRSGTVNLTDQTDSSLNRTGSISSDGSFVVPYVPPGTYTMRVSASSQATSYGRGGGSSSGSTVQFQPVQESVTVTDSDLTGLSVTVTAATSSQ